MSERQLFILQRLSALVMAPMVLLHLGVILYATRAGLSAEAILTRTGSTWLWPAFYAAFVLAVTVHVPIGVRNVLREWTPLGRGTVNAIAIASAAACLILGMRAVWAVSGWAG